MDLANPLRSVAPTVEADVLGVLAKTHASMTGGRVERMARRSHAQVRDVLHRLVSAGLVDAERHGNAVSYRLNREHVLAPAVLTIADASDEIEERIATDVRRWVPPPRAVVVFGSFARRDGDSDSDVDLLLVREDAVGEADTGWQDHRYGLARRLERWTGNRVQIVEMSAAELDDTAMREEDFIVSLREDGRVLLGPALSRLLTPGRSRFAG